MWKFGYERVDFLTWLRTQVWWWRQVRACPVCSEWHHWPYFIWAKHIRRCAQRKRRLGC